MNLGRATWPVVVVVLVAGAVATFVVLRAAGFISDYPPQRPESIPQDTEWAGGYDGGVWVRCAELTGSNPQHFKCDVYSENGSCWLSGGTFQPYEVTWDANKNEAIYKETRLDKLDYSAWDGQFLHLQNGYALKWLGQSTRIPTQPENAPTSPKT